ncbi:MAG: patatin-like phospholipase family protein [Pseudomonadota bacterium]
MMHISEKFFYRLRRNVISLILCWICCVLISNPLNSRADEVAGPQKNDRPKIGLVLGGGGARGAAHIGVLKVLEELQIPVDYIAGTSMGAVVGSLYASGASAAECEKVLTSVDWNDLFRDDPPRDEISFRRKQEDFTYMAKAAVGVKKDGIHLPKAFVAGQKIGVFFETLFAPVAGVTDFDHLPIPYRAVASDLETGEMVVLASGRLAEAARASMSVPGLFPPTDVAGRYLVDGGIVRNLPVDIVRAMGADIIIAVDVGQPLAKRDKVTSSLQVVGQMLDIMMKANVQAQINTLGKQDIFINPELGDLGSGDFHRGKEAADSGEAAARKQLESLRRYAVTDEEYAVFIAGHTMTQEQTVRIASVKVKADALTDVPKEYIEGKLKIKAGEVLSMDELQKKISLIYGIGDFERVDSQLIPNGNGFDVVLTPIEKPWGPNYMKVGINLETNFAGGSGYNILIDDTERWINTLGAEWKNLLQIGDRMGFYSEFYQPLSLSSLWFVAPSVKAEQRFIDFYEEGDIIAEYRARELDWAIDFGMELSSYGEIRLGYVGGVLDPEVQKGMVGFHSDTIHKGGVRLRLIADQLDNVNFPRKGAHSQIELYAARPELGDDFEYNKLDVALSKVFTYKQYTLMGTGQFKSYLDKPLPVYDQVTLGGFLNLSGLATDQLRGQRAALGRLIAYWQANTSIIGDLYLGGSIETGNAWGEGEAMTVDTFKPAGSVFVGFDSVAGPLYIGYGRAEESMDAIYLYLGRTF